MSPANSTLSDVVDTIAAAILRQAPLVEVSPDEGSIRRLVSLQALAAHMYVYVNFAGSADDIGDELWVEMGAIPGFAPPEAIGLSWLIQPPRPRRWLHGSWLIRSRDRGSVGHKLATAIGGGLRSALQDYGDPLAYARSLAPDRYEDPTWIDVAETRAYCLIASGFRDEGLGELQEVARATMPGWLVEDAERAIWGSVTARVKVSLALSLTGDALERQLAEWEAARRRGLRFVG